MKSLNLTRSAATRAALAVLAICTTASFGTGCVLNTTPREECRANSECYEAFGLGTVCSSDGYCAARATNARCTKTFPEDLLDPARGADYKDYVIFGNVAPYEFLLFEQIAESSLLAIIDANESGGIAAGRGFGMIMCDAAPATAERFNDGLEDTVSATNAVMNYLVDAWEVPAVVGPIRSSETQAGFDVVKDKDVLVVSPSATNPVLRDADVTTSPTDQRPGLLWRTIPADDLQTQAIAEDMIAPGAGRTTAVSKVAVVYYDDAYGAALYDAFAASFETGGGRDAQAFPFVHEGEEGAQLDDVLTELSAQGVPFDEILVVSSDTGDFTIFFGIIATNTNFDNVGIFVSEGAASSDVLAESNPARFPQVRGSRPLPLDRTTDRAYDAFLNGYFQEFERSAEDQIYTPNAYDAGWILVAGATWAAFRENNQITGTNMAKGLRKLSSGSTDIELGKVNWVTLRTQLQQGNAVNLRGASGAIDFDGQTEELQTEMQIWTIGANRQIVQADVWFPPEQ